MKQDVNPQLDHSLINDYNANDLSYISLILDDLKALEFFVRHLILLMVSIKHSVTIKTE